MSRASRAPVRAAGAGPSHPSRSRVHGFMSATRTSAGRSTSLQPDSLGHTSEQFVRYRALIHRLVALAEAVDPAQALDEQFSATDAVAQLPGGGLDGVIARMRFSGLAQVLQSQFATAKSFEVGGNRGGLITYWRELADKRASAGSSRRTNSGSRSRSKPRTFRGRPAGRARGDRQDRASRLLRLCPGIEAILGSDLKTKNYAADEWLGFNPAFVYRHRPVKRSVSTAKLAEALVSMTRRVDDFADKAGYDPDRQMPKLAATMRESKADVAVGPRNSVLKTFLA